MTTEPVNIETGTPDVAQDEPDAGGGLVASEEAEEAVAGQPGGVLSHKAAGVDGGTKPRQAGRRKASNFVKAQRRADAMALRVSGASYQQIADQLGITQQSVGSMLDTAFAEIVDATAVDIKHARKLESMRLDDLQVRLMGGLGETVQEMVANPDHEADKTKPAMIPTGEWVPKHDWPTRIRMIETILKIMDRRAKIEGLDKQVPLQVELRAKVVAMMTPMLEGATREELKAMKTLAQNIAARERLALPAPGQEAGARGRRTTEAQVLPEAQPDSPGYSP